MPSRAERRLCIFGDSHIGCLKHALDEGFEPPAGWSVVFFGADGPRFRMLTMEEGRIVAADEARDTVRMISGGPETLAPGDHDATLFMGARIRTGNFFAQRLDRLSRPNGFLSRAAAQAESAAWLRKHRFYGYAREFVAAGQQAVMLAPTTFLTEGIGPDPLAQHPGARQAGSGARAAIWEELARAAGEDGISLIPQPEETVVSGCLTAPEWARAGSAEAGDPAHRSPAYGALVLAAAFARLGGASEMARLRA